MTINNILSAENLTEENLTALAGLAKNLSAQNDEVIKLYANEAILNPETEHILSDTGVRELLERDIVEAESITAEFYPDDIDDFGMLTFTHNEVGLENLWSQIRILFSGLKKKVRRTFCRIVAALEGSQEFDLKKIIKDVLLALIPALAATTGLMPVAVPIVVSLAAMLLKYGVSKVCPA